MVCLPLSAATSPRYRRMMDVYEASIGWPGGAQKIGVMNRGPVCFVPMTGPPWKSRGGVPTAGSLAVLVGGVAVEEDLADVAHPVDAETARVIPLDRALPVAPAGAEQAAVGWLAVVVSLAAAPVAFMVAPVNSAVASAARAATTLPWLRIRGFTGNPFRRAGVKVSARLTLWCTPLLRGARHPSRSAAGRSVSTSRRRTQ